MYNAIPIIILYYIIIHILKINDIFPKKWYNCNKIIISGFFNLKQVLLKTCNLDIFLLLSS